MVQRAPRVSCTTWTLLLICLVPLVHGAVRVSSSLDFEVALASGAWVAVQDVSAPLRDSLCNYLEVPCWTVSVSDVRGMGMNGVAQQFRLQYTVSSANVVSALSSLARGEFAGIDLQLVVSFAARGLATNEVRVLSAATPVVEEIVATTTAIPVLLREDSGASDTRMGFTLLGALLASLALCCCCFTMFSRLKYNASASPAGFTGVGPNNATPPPPAADPALKGGVGSPGLLEGGTRGRSDGMVEIGAAEAELVLYNQHLHLLAEQHDGDPQFRAAVAWDLARSLAVAHWRVEVYNCLESTAPPGVVVQFKLLQPTDRSAGPEVRELLRTLRAQLSTPGSRLRTGPFSHVFARAGVRRERLTKTMISTEQLSRPWAVDYGFRGRPGEQSARPPEIDTTDPADEGMGVGPLVLRSVEESGARAGAGSQRRGGGDDLSIWSRASPEHSGENRPETETSHGQDQAGVVVPRLYLEQLRSRTPGGSDIRAATPAGSVVRGAGGGLRNLPRPPDTEHTAAPAAERKPGELAYKAQGALLHEIQIGGFGEAEQEQDQPRDLGPARSPPWEHSSTAPPASARSSTAGQVVSLSRRHRDGPVTPGPALGAEWESRLAGSSRPVTPGPSAGAEWESLPARTSTRPVGSGPSTGAEWYRARSSGKPEAGEQWSAERRVLQFDPPTSAPYTPASVASRRGIWRE